MRVWVWWWFIAAIIVFVSTTIAYISFSLIGIKTKYEIKWRYLKAILTKDAEWYESRNVNQLPSEVFTNLNEVQNATGIAIALILISSASIVAGVASMFYCSILLGLVNLIVAPYVIGCTGYQNLVLKKVDQKHNEAFIKSGADAEQAFSSIKVVKAFGQEQYETRKFENHLQNNVNEIKKVSILYGLSQGLIDSVILVGRSYSLLMGAIFTINEVF